MAGAPAIPGSPIDYGSGYSTLGTPVTMPNGLLNGLGPAQLNTSAVPLQTYSPNQSAISGTSSMWNGVSPSSLPTALNDLKTLAAQYPGFNVNLTNGQYTIPMQAFGDPNFAADMAAMGLGGPELASIMGQLNTQQNQNVAGYDATQQANAQNLGYLQQAAIAQNRLLGELNARGLLNSFENGGAGTADFQQLQNELNNAVNDKGVGLQNELSGLTQQDAMYQLALSNYNNEMQNFNNYKNSQVPGLTDILGLGGSALNLLGA